MVQSCPQLLAYVDVTGPGSPILSSILLSDTLWIAARCSPCNIHLFVGSALQGIIHLPEDANHVEFGLASVPLENLTDCPSNRYHRHSAQMTRTDHHATAAHLCLYLLVITEADRAWMLRLRPAGRKAYRESQSQSLTFAQPVQQHCCSGTSSSSGDGQVQVQWVQLNYMAMHESTISHHWASPESAAWLHMPSFRASRKSSGESSLAAQMAWEYLARSPDAQSQGSGSETCSFVDLSGLGRQQRMHIAGTPRTDCDCPPVMTAIMNSTSRRQGHNIEHPLNEATCTLLLAPARPDDALTDERSCIRCSSSVRITMELLSALLRRDNASAAACSSCSGCLLAGDAHGRVWAHIVAKPEQHANGTRDGATECATAGELQPGSSDGQLLFDLQQPVAAILPTMLSDEEQAPSLRLDARVHDCLIVVGQQGRIVQLCLGCGSMKQTASRVWRAAPERCPPGSSHKARTPTSEDGKSTELVLRQMQVGGPLTSVAVAQGVLYYTSGGSAHAVALPAASQDGGADALHTGSQGSPSTRTGSHTFHELQSVALPCGPSPHLIGVADAWSSPAAGTAAANAASPQETHQAVNAASRLLMLCTNGCLLVATLLPAAMLSAVNARLSSSEVNQGIQVWPS
jgi:hypothetical protein